MATPKSKASKQKIRRWSFVVKATKVVDGKELSQSFQPPALTIGNKAQAEAAAKDIERDLVNAPQFQDAKISVTPEGHETVSQAILNQINGLNDETRLITTALKLAVTDLLAVKSVDEELDYGNNFDTKLREALGRYIQLGADSIKREQLIAQGINPDDIVEENVEAIPENYAAEQPVIAEPAEV